MGETLRFGLSDLLTACRRVAPALGTERPIHSAIRIASIDGRVAVEAHNSELHFRASIEPADISDFAELLVPGRLFTRFLRVLEETGEEHVELVVDSAGDIGVRSGQAEMNLRLLEADDWPQAELRTDSAVALSHDDVGRLRSVLFAASTDVAKGPLVGIRISGQAVTGLDNARLAQATLDAVMPDCLVPATFLKESMRESIGPVRWAVDGRRAVLIDDHGFWSSVLMSHEFPDRAVSELLARTVDSWCAVETRELTTALGRLAVLESSRVRISSADAETTLRVETPEIGDIEATIPSEGSFVGPAWFDRRHLVDAIHHHDSSVARFDFTGADKPVLLMGDRLQQMLVSSTRSG